MSKIATVVFAYPVLHPLGHMASSIRAEGNVSIERNGDTVVVSATAPEQEARGLPTSVTRHYNWSAVTWIEYVDEPVKRK